MFWEYHLPPERIAQEPAEPRDSARLLRLDRNSGTISHRTFRDLPEILRPGDLLVLNDTRVLPARILGVRESTGGKWEALFLRETSEGLWECLAKCGGRPRVGEALNADGLRLIYRGRQEDHSLFEPVPAGRPIDLLERFGRMPLPPYIRGGIAESADRERYQTVFNRVSGSVAAPTAGLHFTPELLGRLAERGISRTAVTLHVGRGTFEPVRADDPLRHAIHGEWASVPADAVEAVARCKSGGGRVIAVGTTAARALESAAADGSIVPWQGETNLYIYPPYRFRTVDCLITNFHLPKTTLLLLVAALAGEELLRRAYETAIAGGYRFYSYGDAMLVE